MMGAISEDASQRKVMDDIAEHGWHCVHILAEEEAVGYSFTVGLFRSYGYPELVMFGLPAKVAHRILGIAAEAVKSGAPLDFTQPSDALIVGYRCCFVEVPLSEYQEHVGMARWYYQGNGFPLYQIVWPSRSGLFPWHSQASAEFRAVQPVIAQAPGSN